MCQLLGMNCNVPTDICFSFSGFQARGGLTDHHKDGWGIAFFEGKGTRLFLDPLPSAHSPIADIVRNYPIKSKNVVAHIRKATQGVIALENTHPFLRELWGYNWIFAHNGNLKSLELDREAAFQPTGGTDSEKAFCTIMQKLRDEFGSSYPGPAKLFESLHRLTLELAPLGEFNFLMSNGECLFAHASTRLAYIIRQAPFATARLKDQDLTVDFSSLTTAQDRVAIIATTPLTDNEDWTTMEAGTLWMFEEGDVSKTAKTLAGPPPNQIATV